MWPYVAVGLAAAVGIAGIVLRTRAKLGGEFRAGDFFKVAIPRTADKPLSMGTRMDVAAFLKKRGATPEELRPLLDGAHDQELLDRYWKLKDAEAPPSA